MKAPRGVRRFPSVEAADAARASWETPSTMPIRPALRSVVLDALDARLLAEFYRELLGYAYRSGDEVPPPGEPDPRGADWLVLVPPAGDVRIAVQQVSELAASTWPAHTVPMQMHLDLSVPTAVALAAAHEEVQVLGARVLLDRTDDPDEPLYVYADPAGHPFCIFVAEA